MTSTRAELLGFLIRDSDDPTTELLPVDAGMTVLYGLNGAGKSRTLDDIRSFWAGTKTWSIYALARLPSDPPPIDHNGELGRADWYADWGRRGRSDSSDHDDVLSAWLKGCLEASAVTGDPLGMNLPWLQRRELLTDEWLTQRLILIEAIGSATSPQWASAPAFVTNENTPRINAEVELVEYIEATDSWDVHTGETCLVPSGRTPSGTTIACAAVFSTGVLDVDLVDFSAGKHQQLLALSPDLVIDFEDVDEHTRVEIAAHLGVLDEERLEDETAQTSPDELVEVVSFLEQVVNQHFAAAMRDAPRLRLHVSTGGLDKPCEWYVDPREPFADERLAASVPSDHRVEELSVKPFFRERTLRNLSSAQRKWANWSIALALRELTNRERRDFEPRLILLDEPEAALHRSAEEDMANYLIGLSNSDSARLLIATHSPELLDLTNTRVTS